MDDDQTYIDKEVKIIKQIINDCEQKYPDARIVFVTSHDELIFNALHTFPFYFVRKQHEEELLYVLNKVKSLWQDDTISIKIPYTDEVINVPLHNIILIEKEGSYSYIETKEARYKQRISLKEIKKQCNQNFITINK